MTKSEVSPLKNIPTPAFASKGDKNIKIEPLKKIEEVKIPIPHKNTDLNHQSEKKSTEEMSNRILMTDSSMRHSEINH
jgi:hypothetical protein